MQNRIEICLDARGQKLGRRLLRSIFDYSADMATSLGKQNYIVVNGFSAKGERSILPVMRDFSIEYSKRGVTFDCPEPYRK
jgi:hypothetical protein